MVSPDRTAALADHHVVEERAAVAAAGRGYFGASSPKVMVDSLPKRL
jgi:hypothetical protein